MDLAVADARRARSISKASAFAYRDGLIIAVLAVIAHKDSNLGPAD